MIASIGQSDLSLVAGNEARHVIPITEEQLILVPTGAGRMQPAALGAFAALLGIVFLLLLAADQAQSVAALF